MLLYSNVVKRRRGDGPGETVSHALEGVPVGGGGGAPVVIAVELVPPIVEGDPLAEPFVGAPDDMPVPPVGGTPSVVVAEG